MEVVDYAGSMAPLLCVSVSADSVIGSLSGEFKILWMFVLWPSNKLLLL